MSGGAGADGAHSLQPLTTAGDHGVIEAAVTVKVDPGVQKAVAPRVVEYADWNCHSLGLHDHGWHRHTVFIRSISRGRRVRGDTAFCIHGSA